jgi:hemolysin activation/secretion protein
MNRLARTEDWNLGSRLTVRGGWSSPAWGADASEAIAALDWSRGVGSGGRRHVVLLDAHAGGRFGDGPAANLLVGGQLRHFFSNLGRHQLCSSVQFDVAHNLDPENQLLLGGDNGLRGYPLRFRDGDRRVLATVEQRFNTDLEVLKLFHVGAAIFVDAGRAWYAGAPPGTGDEILRDIGIGLRLGSSRSSKGAMVHLDVALPLDGDRSERRGLQWLVRTQDSF